MFYIPKDAIVTQKDGYTLFNGVKFSVITQGKISPFKGSRDKFMALQEQSVDAVIKHVPLRKPSSKAPNLLVRVTQHIIDNATPNSTTNCMYVMGVKQALIEKGYDTWGWEVSDGTLSFNMNHPGIDNNYTKFLWKLAPELFDKTAEFDDTKRRALLKPFAFKLNAGAATSKPGRKQALRSKKNKPRDPNVPYGSGLARGKKLCVPRRHLGKKVRTGKSAILQLDGALGPKIMEMNAI